MNPSQDKLNALRTKSDRSSHLRINELQDYKGSILVFEENPSLAQSNLEGQFRRPLPNQVPPKQRNQGNHYFSSNSSSEFGEYLLQKEIQSYDSNIAGKTSSGNLKKGRRGVRNCDTDHCETNTLINLAKKGNIEDNMRYLSQSSLLQKNVANKVDLRVNNVLSPMKHRTIQSDSKKIDECSMPSQTKLRSQIKSRRNSLDSMTMKLGQDDAKITLTEDLSRSVKKFERRATRILSSGIPEKSKENQLGAHYVLDSSIKEDEIFKKVWAKNQQIKKENARGNEISSLETTNTLDCQSIIINERDEIIKQMKVKDSEKSMKSQFNRYSEENKYSKYGKNTASDTSSQDISQSMSDSGRMILNESSSSSVSVVSEDTQSHGFKTSQIIHTVHERGSMNSSTIREYGGSVESSLVNQRSFDFQHRVQKGGQQSRTNYAAGSLGSIQIMESTLSGHKMCTSNSDNMNYGSRSSFSMQRSFNREWSETSQENNFTTGGPQGVGIGGSLGATDSTIEIKKTLSVVEAEKSHRRVKSDSMELVMSPELSEPEIVEVPLEPIEEYQEKIPSIQDIPPAEIVVQQESPKELTTIYKAETVETVISDVNQVEVEIIPEELIPEYESTVHPEEILEEELEIYKIEASSSASLTISSSDIFVARQQYVSHDSDYLKQHLGAQLVLALSEIAYKRPADPIHYLAHWLYKYRWNQDFKQRRNYKVEALQVEKQRLDNIKKEHEQDEQERQEAEEAFWRNREQMENEHVAEETLVGEVKSVVQDEGADKVGSIRVLESVASKKK